MTARVLVVEHEANAGIGLVGERLEAAGIELLVVGPEAGGEVPETAQGVDGVIVLGGTPGPTDDDDAAWLPGVRALIGDCLDRELPFLGICLGAQLLAVVAGGVVGPARDTAEVGLHPLALTDEASEDPLLGGLGDDLAAMQWHFLEVLELPAGSQSLCRSDGCRNQAFRVGAAAWGVQFHLEALASTAEAWARDDSDDLAAVGLTRSAVVEPMRSAEPALRRTWSRVADRWGAIVLAERAADADADAFSSATSGGSAS
ncbi:type 1 glutamine amidotransferase [Agromyces aureus]|uniref:type 1 glutamine amidotransferase n=1 Tax=Agromyces aureus TaxID=453304 RepID=UPI0008333B7A|nr:type 1 glutamine amidotransferase [Agromyces aureus]